ncbi:MAG: hypothetical protein K2W96_21635 [Gemmataceae bacterium]|nr:hypothetical protein [Gemmataceae bacterium]
MTPRPEPPIPAAFAYTLAPLVRRHGPRGYADDADYKPFLRDECGYACVYCLTREAWLPQGHAALGVEHLDPRSIAAAPAEYDRLAYSCCQCNSHRGTRALPFDPSDGLGAHVENRRDGTIRARTLFGARFILACGLDRAELTRFRRLMIELLDHLAGTAPALLRQWLAYPDDLPDLSLLRPPGGNARPEGIARSAFARRARGELPETY